MLQVPQSKNSSGAYTHTFIHTYIQCILLVFLPGLLPERSHADLSYIFWVRYSELHSWSVFPKRSGCYY